MLELPPIAPPTPEEGVVGGAFGGFSEDKDGKVEDVAWAPEGGDGESSVSMGTSASSWFSFLL